MTLNSEFDLSYEILSERKVQALVTGAVTFAKVTPLFTPKECILIP